MDRGVTGAREALYEDELAAYEQDSTLVKTAAGPQKTGSKWQRE